MNIFKALFLNDKELDKKMKIQGTKYDRKRKVTPKIVKKMLKMRKKGIDYAQIAEKFGVSQYTVKYNLDPDFRSNEIIRNSLKSKTHKNNLNNRPEYKRNIIMRRWFVA